MHTTSHSAALTCLADFVASTGEADDLVPLAPYLRHRIVTEHDVLGAILAQRSARSAHTHLHSLFQRSHCRAWLARHPQDWSAYRRDLAAALAQVQTQSGLRQRWEAA
ncbi:MAG: DNA photolyase, partial [Loktanella sp.]|nr:DNA photolyase [Loktanella sp.]